MKRLTPKFKVLLQRQNKSEASVYNVPYSTLEVKKVLRNLYDLPETAEVVLDVKRVIPWLSKFYQCIVVMYAKSYPITTIQQYYAMYTGGKIPVKEVDKRSMGYRIIDMVVKEVMELMACDMVTVKYHGDRTISVDGGEVDE